jgi:hypothetical protein
VPAPEPDAVEPELDPLELPSPAGASAAIAGLTDKPKIKAIMLTMAINCLNKPTFPDDIKVSREN